MNILLVHNFYQSKQKGGEDVVFRQELAELKQRLGEDHVFEYTVHNDDLKLWQLPFTIFHHKKHAKKINLLCRDHNIDLVHVHNFFPMLTASIFVAAKKAGCKVVHTLHNYRWWCLNGALFYRGKACHRCLPKRMPWPGVTRGCYRRSRVQSLLAGLAFRRYKRKEVLNSIDAYFVLSHHQLQMVKDWLPAKKIFLKANAILVPPATQSPRNGYVFVGRLEQGKGIEEVLKAWQSLPKRFVLTIIGRGELEYELMKRYAAGNIHFLGDVPSEQVALALSSAKYCLHPSLYYETFGLVMLEALARGTPVIGFPIGTRTDFIRHGINGFLCQPKDLTELILRADEAQDYQALSQEARKTAEHYAIEPIMQNQIHLYQQILATP